MAGNKFTEKLEKSKSLFQGSSTRQKVELQDLMVRPEINEATLRGRVQTRLVCLPPERFFPDPDQPRKTINPEKVAQLRASIEKNGQSQPIYVGEANADGLHPIYVGERRWRAISGSSVVTTIYAFVCDRPLDDLERLLIQIDENDVREDVNPIERAYSYRRVRDLLASKNGEVTDTEVAERLSISTGALSKALKLLEAPDEVRKLGESGVVRDTDTLYQLTKLHETSPVETMDLVSRWKSGEVANLLRGAKELAKETKGEKSKREAAPVDAGSARKVSASAVAIEDTAEGITLSISVGKKVQVYKIDAETVSSLRKDIAKFWSDKND